MARISTYPIISTPTVDDLLIGTDVNDLNITKNFTIGEIGQLIGQDYVPYVGATGNVNLGSFNITAGGFIVGGGTAGQFLKANGTLDSTVYTPQTRTLTINGTTYNLSANRSWDLNTLDSLTTIGTGGAATYIGKVLNIPVYQAQGAYITQLSGEATAVGPGNATVTLDNTAVISKILTGLNVTGGTVLATDTILQAFGKVQNQINGLAGGVEYQGTWNAATNNPFLQSSVGVQGHYYVVNVAGNTNLNGITDWQLGDWAIYNGSAWEKVDNTDAVVSVNGYTGAVVLTSSDVGAVPTTRTITINGVGYNLSADRSWTVGDVRTDQSYINPSWIASLAWSKITGTPTTLAGYGITDGALNTRTLTINGITYDLTANRTWNVGTVTSVGTSGPITGGTITGSGTIGITQAGASSDGYLSSADWNAFNSKQEVISVTAPITFAAGVIGITQSGASSNGYLSSTDWTTFNSKVSGSGTANTIPMWGTASSLINSPLSYAADAFNFQYNSATGGTVNFTNIGLIPYTYSIQMNNFGSPRSTVHSYTDGVVIQSIGGIQVSRMFADGNLILGTSSVNTGHKLTISGDLYINTIVNAISDTDRFIVSDGGVIKYRTGSEILSDIGAQAALTLTTIGTSGPATLISNTLNIPDYGSVLTGYVPYTGATQNVNLGEFGISAGYFQADLTPTQAAGVGRLIWNNADGTLNLRLLGGNVDLHLGQQQYARVVNGTGGNVLRSNYQVVKIIGAQGQRMQVGLARADNDANSKDTIGLIAENINNNNEGFVVSSGLIEEINTTGSLQGETWADGDTLYLSGTIFGTLTNIKPTAPIHTVIVGFVVYAHANHGKIFVKVDNGYELEELHDVSAEPFVNNGLLYRDTTLNLWKSATISTILGYTPAPQGNYITSLTGEATASGPGAASVTLSNSAVTGKVLTGLNITGNAIVSTDSILTAFGKLQNQVNQLVGGLQYEGTWNASTNTPTITSSVGTDGTFYIVNVAGTTNINGINDWQVGDWIVFHDTAWQKVDNSDSVSSVFGRVGNVVANQSDYSAFYPLIADIKDGVLTVQGTGVLSGSGTFSANQATNNTITLTHAAVSRTDTTSAQTPSFGGSFTAIDSVTSSAEGHITAINTKTVTVPSTVASALQTGLLSSTDWSIFNGKQNAITLTTTGTTGPATLIGATLNIPNYTPDLSGYVTLGTDQTITGLKTIIRSGDVLNFKIGTDTLYGLKVAYNQNELVPSGEATWSFVNTFNRNGVGYETTPISFFRGVLVTGERLLSASINTNLLDYYSNNPSGRYPVYAYNTGVQQFSTGIIVGKTTGVVNAATGAIADLPAGVVANFNGRVIGENAVNSNEFVTLSQVSGYVPTSRTITINGTTQDLSANRTFNVGTVTSVTASSPLASSGGTTPNITISQASGSTNGFLSSTDWTTFNSKQNTITLTTTGTSGAATLVGATLNIPNYGSALSGYLPLTGGTLTGPLTIGTSVNSVIWNDGNGTYIENTGNTSSSRKIRLQAHNGSFSYTQLFIDGAGGFVEATNQMRSPIFYDSNNTGYYLDAASSGTSLNINGGISTTAASGSILLRHPVSEANAWLFMENAPNWGLFWFNTGTQSGQTIGSYTTIGAELFGTNNAVAGFNPNSAWTGTDANTRATWMLSNYSGYIWSNSTIFAAGDMRAPIFYDSNNTGFYIDAASTSVLNALTVGGSSVVTNNGGTWGISITGNSATATNLSNNWTNWNSVGGFSSVVGSLAWKNYGNNHVIFDASNSTSPTGSGVNSTNPDVAWSATYPTLMGWNGSSTYGVRVDSARNADTVGGFTAATFYRNIGFGSGYPSWDLNTVDPDRSGFTYSNGGPYTGPFIHIGASGYGLQFNAPYGGDGYGLAFRTRNGDTGSWNNWKYPAVYGINVNGGGALYATIYYDQNNTAYYVDAASTSNIYRLTMNERITLGVFPNSTTNTGEAWIGRAADRNAGTMTVQLGGNSPSSRQFEVVDYAWSVVLFSAGSDGNSIASSSFRAPIFYDQNNTGFYFDGAGTTNINVLSGNGKEVMQTSDSYLRINQSNTFSSGTWFGGTLIRGDGFYAGSNGGTTSSRVAIQSGSYNGTNVINIDGSNGRITATGDMRAPIFYDSNDTTYYVDPASGTNLYSTFQVSGSHSDSQIGVRLLASNNGAGTGEVNLRMWCSEPGVTWAWAGFGYNVTNNNGSPGGFGRLNTNFGQAYMRFSTDGELYFYNTNTGGTRTQSLYLGSSGAALFGNTIQNGSVWINNGGNFNAYDENIRLFNAPNGVSVIAFSATGLSGVPTTSILGYSDRMEFRYSSGAQYRIYNGYTESMGSSRAPIFYDSDNTAFYLDPATGSQLNGIVTQNYLTASSCALAVTGVGGQITLSSSISTFGSWFRATQHIVIENTIGGYNIYVLDANGVGVVKNAGAQSWSAHSDARIKTVHSTLQNNLSKLDSINPIYYSFNNFADDKNRIGLIAQEVQEHFPELVATDPKTDNLTLDYTGLIPVLLGAIKELKTEIETLKTQL